MWEDFSDPKSNESSSMNQWDDFGVQDSQAKPPEGRTALGTAGDIGTALSQSVVSWGTGLVALADMMTPGDLQGWMKKNLGYDPKATTSFINDLYSIPQKEANKRVDAATGFLGTMEAYAQNPSVIAKGALENATTLAGAGALGRGIQYIPKIGEAIGVLGRSALGEGLITAGQQDLQVRQETGKETTLKQKGLSALAGLGTGAINLASGGVAQKLGLSDINTLLTGGRKGSLGKVAGGLGGALQEGVLEELPQSAQEQALQNIATGRPVKEGVGKAAAQGAVIGGLMGGGTNVIVGPESNEAPAPKRTPDAPDVARAALEREIQDSIARLDSTIAGINKRVSDVYSDLNVKPVEIFPDNTVTGTQNDIEPGNNPVLKPVSGPGASTRPVYNLADVPFKSDLLRESADNMQAIQDQDNQRRDRFKQATTEKDLAPEAKRSLLKEARSLVKEEPVYKIMADAKKAGGINLDSMQDYRGETIRQIQKRYPGLISRNGTMQLDEIADQHKMTGDQLVEQLKSVPSIKDRRKQIYLDLSAQYQEAETQRAAALKDAIPTERVKKEQAGIESEVSGIVDAINSGVSWAQEKTIAKDKRFSDDQKQRILDAQNAQARPGTPPPSPPRAQPAGPVLPSENANADNNIQQAEAGVVEQKTTAEVGIKAPDTKKAEGVPTAKVEKLAEAIGNPEAAKNAALSNQTEEQQIGQIVDDAVKQPLDIAELADKKGKTELADQYRKKAQENGDSLRAADGEITDKIVGEALGENGKKVKREYVKPSSVDTPSQGVLNGALEGKKKAWKVVQNLQRRIKDEPLGGNRQGLRLELIKAKSAHREYLQVEREARKAIEKIANEFGQTTKILDKKASAIINRINKKSPGHALRFDGKQEGFGPVEDAYLFTPTEGPAAGTTFSVKKLDTKSVQTALDESVAKYEKQPKVASKSNLKQKTPAKTTKTGSRLDSKGILYSRSNVIDWPTGFPNTVIHSNLSSLRGAKNKKTGKYEGGHPSYYAAKHDGSLFDAMVLVDDLLDVKKIKKLKSEHPDAVVVAPHAQESGDNAIPLMIARRFEKYGFGRERDIVQVNKVSRTGKDAALRLVIRPAFEGNVVPGQEYILVDDAAGQGGTFSELRHYIENSGGKVVATSSLAQGMFSAKLSVREETVKKLIDKFGKDNLINFLVEHNIAGSINALTEKEARYILGNSTIAGLENRIFKAAKAEGISPERWGYKTRDEIEGLQLKSNTGESSLPGSKFSKTAKKSPTGATAQQIEQESKSFLGRRLFRKWIRNGTLKIVKNGKDTGSEILSKDGQRVAGYYDKKTGKITLIADNIKPGDAKYVLLHEAAHRLLHQDKAFIANKETLLSAFHKLADYTGDNKNRIAQAQAINKAIKQAKKAEPNGDADLLRQEALSYFLQNKENHEMPFIRRVIAKVKVALMRVGIPVKGLTTADFIEIFTGGIKRDGGGVVETGEKQQAKPDIMKSVLTNDQQDFMDAGGFGIAKKETLKDKYNKATVLLGDKLRQGLVDQFHSINKILKDKDAWMMAHLTKSDTGVLMAAINTGEPFLGKSGAVDVRTNSKSLKQILEPIGDEVDRFLAWIAANRSEKLMAEGRENLFTPEQIEAGKSLSDGELENGSSRNEEYEKVRKDFETMGAAITDIAVKTGLVDQQEALRWKNEGFYVPFYRMLEDSGVKGPSNLQALTNQKAYKKLKGGTSQINDLLTNTLMNWNHLISAGLRNQAGKKALDSAVDLGIAQVVPKEFKGKDSVYVRDNGKEVWYDFDDTPESRLVLDSLMALNYEGMNNAAMKGMRMFKRALTAGVTAGPGFKIRNIIRDSIHAPAVSTASKNPLKNIFVGVKNDAAMERMKAGGGAFSQEGYIHGSDPDAIKQLVGVQRDSILNTAGLVRKMWRKYEEFGNTLENINRVASFQKDIAAGKTLLEANFNARDQLDFSRSGNFPMVRMITQTVPFLNARAQGLDKIGRALADTEQRKQFGQVVGMYTMASVALMLSMMGDSDYDEAEDWEKRTYHLFKIPGSDKMYRIPRPFETGSIGYMMEEMTKTFIDKNQDVKDLGNALQHTITNTFAMNPIPQAFKPLVEIYANKNMFTGRDIESMSMQRLSKKERSKPWTSKTAKGASSLMSSIMPEDLTLSPVQIQHLVRAYTGWAGAQTLAAIDFMVKKSTGEITPEVKLSEYKWNPLESLSRDKETRSSKYITKFYDNLSFLSREWADIKKYRSLGSGKVTKEMMMRQRYRKLYNKTSRQLSRLRKREEAVYTSKSYTATQKRRRIKDIRAQKNKITKNLVLKTENLF